jgi:MFS family permease
VPDWQTALVLMIIPFVIMAMWFPPALALLQNECRPEIRAVMAGIFLTFCGIVGTGGGPALVGLLSDSFAGAEAATSLNWAMTAIVPFFLVAALAHFVNAAQMGRRTVAVAAAE